MDSASASEYMQEAAGCQMQAAKNLDSNRQAFPLQLEYGL
jgi:hypothetical protein